MSRKNQTTRAVDDTTFRAPRTHRKPKADVTFAEALAESGETIEDLVTPAEPTADERPVRPAGNSNLACTIRQHRHRYSVALHPNGKKTQNNGDAVATLLLAIPLAALKDFGGMRFDGRRYDHLNDGHARMCLGNLIRAAWNKGESDVMSWVMAQQPKDEAEGDEA